MSDIWSWLGVIGLLVGLWIGDCKDTRQAIDSICARLAIVEPDLDATARELVRADRSTCLRVVRMRSKGAGK